MCVRWLNLCVGLFSDCDKKYCDKKIVIIEKKIVMIEKNCDNWKKLWKLKNCDKKIHACYKMNFSSNINEVIRAVLKFIFLFTKRFCTKKHQKAQKRNRAKV